MNLYLVGHKNLAVECVCKVMGRNFWRCEWALSSGCWVDVGYRRPCEGAGSGGYLCCLYRTGWLRALLCCWGCRRSQVWEAASLEQGRVWWGTAQGVLAGCAGEQWGNLGYQRCSTIMDGNHPEEGTHPPGKLKAAGLIEGFQVWCKVKWFTIREISFPVCCGFLFLVFFFHYLSSMWLILLPVQRNLCFWQDLQQELLLSPDKSHPILGLRHSHQKSSHGFVLHWIKAKAATARTHLISCEYYYQLTEWNFVVLLRGFSCSSLSCANESQCVCNIQASAFYYDLNSGLLTQSGIGNTWL